MKYLFLFLLMIYSQVSFAQYKFKYNSKVTTLESIDVETFASKGIDYYSKKYKTDNGDTLTIEPKISLIVRNESNIDKIIKQFSGKLSFQKKVGRVYIYNCNVNNSDEVVKITTTLCDNEEVLGCEAMFDFKVKPFNTLYSQQYYLKNSSGVDINVEPAWKIASGLGNNIIVAVIDEGVEHNHEDLPNVLDGYTVKIGGNGEPLQDHLNAHGTSCAGIIAAANNSIGIRGIASNVKILPINVCPMGEYAETEFLAEAILWASKKADVLSCSWGGQGKTPMVLADAILNALTNGRNGKGCVVVFAAGNDAPIVNGLATPACEHGVISVGAVHRDGTIWDYSQRGVGLSLVAPSGNIFLKGDIVTTDRMGSLGYDSGNYVYTFGGTSAACPQVAGVAALMLSVRPDLTTEEVKNALQNTATDLGTSGYDTTYGYGLVNAYAAVKEVAPYISGVAEAKGKATFVVNNLPAGAVVTWNILASDKSNVNMTVTGDGNKQCVLELKGSKTVRTTLSATVTLNGTILTTNAKVITLLGTFSGTYSVTATTVNGVSFPAIVNRPFSVGQTLEAHAGSTVTITSNDLYSYTPSWSGVAVENWRYSFGNTLSFSYPSTAKQGYTNLSFKNAASGNTATLKVYLVQPPYSMNISLSSGVLEVNISKSEQVEAERNTSSLALYANETWTIEVINVATGTRQAKIATSTGNWQFDTTHWTAGIYLVRATNGEQTITEKVIVK